MKAPNPSKSQLGEVDQGCVYLSFQEWKFHNLSEQTAPVFHHSYGRKFFFNTTISFGVGEYRLLILRYLVLGKWLKITIKSAFS